MEARASRMSRSENSSKQAAQDERKTLDDGTPVRNVTRVDDLSSFGIGPARKG